MVVQTRSWAEPWVMFTFIKKTADAPGAPWEKLAAGRTVKMVLPELAAILAVCRGDRGAWKTFHKFNGDGTPIEVRYERAKGGNTPDSVVFAVGGYVRPVAWPESVVLRDLLEHVFAEKIIHATGPVDGKGAPANEGVTPADACEDDLPAEPISESPATPDNEPAPTNPNQDAPAGGIRAAAVPHVTPKAVCVANSVGVQLWVPKSALADGVSPPEQPIEQPWIFSVKPWFAQKTEFQAWASGA